MAADPVVTLELAERRCHRGEDGGPGGAGLDPSPQTQLFSSVLLAVDEPDEPRLGAASGIRARVGTALVGGGDPPQ